MNDSGYIEKKDLHEFFKKSIMARLLMDEFFEWYNRSVKFTSLFRSKEHNAEVGGASKSRHLKDLAFDFLYPDEWNEWNLERQELYWENVRAKLEELSAKYGLFFGMFKYSWGLHIDWCDRTYNIEMFM